MGGLARAAKYDGFEVTNKAREIFANSFLKRIQDEYPDLPETEQLRRADALRRLHYAKLAYLSAKSRAERKN